MKYSYIVLLDGIWVPALELQVSWNAQGIQASVSLVPSIAAERVMASTHVHVFKVETGIQSVTRRAVEISVNDENTEDLILRREDSSNTVGIFFAPEFDTESKHLSTSAKFHSIHYRFGGEVISTSLNKVAKAGKNVTLTVRGYEHLTESLSVIQLTRGRGTFKEEERRFFGQARGIAVGTGRRAFYRGIMDILSTEGGLVDGVRRLIAVFPAMVNDMWNNRFQWCRLAAQVVGLDEDESVERLLETNAFERLLRDKLQQSYQTSLLQCMMNVLEFVQYKFIPIPTPAFFPLVPKRATTLHEVEIREKVPAGITIFPHAYINVNYIILCRNVNSSEPPDNLLIEDVFESDGTLHRDGVTVEFRINHSILGTFTVTYNTYVGFGATGEERLTEGDRFSFKYDLVAPLEITVGSADSNFSAVTEQLTFDVFMYSKLRRAHIRTSTVEEERDPPPQENFYPNDVLRLNTYAILPDLWWACPPACNVFIPEEIKSFNLSDPGQNKITRLLGKISPSRHGSSRIFVDKFVAPTNGDINLSAENPDDDPVDAEHLSKYEYVGGVKASVHYFERLHRLVKEEAWAPYLKNMISMKYWGMRLGDVRANLVVKSSMRPVIGAPALIIRGVTSPGDVNPETICLRRRLGKLRLLRSKLKKCLSSLHSGSVSNLRRYIEALYNMRILANVQVLSSDFVDFNGRVDLQATAAHIRENVLTSTGSSRAEIIIAYASGRTIARDGVSARVYNYVPRYSSITRDTILRYIGEEGLVIFTASGSLSNYPTTSTLRRWWLAAPSRVRTYGSCRSAINADLEVIEEGIESTIALLSERGYSTIDSSSFVGMVASISEQVRGSNENMSIALTHVRRLGEDLDWDGLPGDDVENAITFGEEGYLDSKFSVGEIGEKVYKPIFGCGSVADVANSLPQVDEEVGEITQVQGLPCDGSDIIDRLTFEEPCPSRCSLDDGDTSSGFTTTTACKMLVGEYFRLVESGADTASIFEWLESIRKRLTMTIADAYRDSPATFQADTGSPDMNVDFSRDDSEIYGSTFPARGFFADSFIGPNKEADRVEVKFQRDGEDQALPFEDKEKELLIERTQRILDYLKSLDGFTYEGRG